MHESARRLLAAAVVACVATPALLSVLSAGAPQEKPRPGEPEPWRGLVGSWHVTSGQRSLVISIEPDGKALVLFIQPGQHSIERVAWEPFHGGILLHDLPRKRLWPGRHDQELRAEIEPVPELGYDPDEKFHQRFFMRRVGERTLPEGWRDRPVPASWTREALDKAWDATAGKRPVAKNAR